MKSRKIYVGNLNEDATHAELEELFRKYGEIDEVTKKAGSNYGFVVMSSRSEAETAKQALNGLQFNGRVLAVHEARPQKKRSPILSGKRRARVRTDFHKTGHLEDW